MVGTPGVVGRTTPVRGGGGREVSGPRLGLRVRSLVIGIRSSEPPGEFGWRRCRSGRRVAEAGGADGVRGGGAKRSLGLGKVSDRFGVTSGSSALSGPFAGAPKPPYPFGLCGFGTLPLPKPLLMLEAEVLGFLSFASLGRLPGPAAEGRRPKGSDVLFTEFMRSIKLGGCFFGGLARDAGSSYPFCSSNPPYPPDLVDCDGGGELLAISGEKYSSTLLASRRPIGVCGDTLLCEPLEPLMGVSWS